MAYEQKDNDGVLFANDNRETDSHPNAKGTAMIGGVMYFVSAWTNTSKNGQKYQKLSFQQKDEQPSGNAPASAPAADDDGDLPF